MHKSKQNLGKFFAKLLKYMLLFKDVLTFLGLDYRNASLMTFYFVVLETIIQKKKRDNNKKKMSKK